MEIKTKTEGRQETHREACQESLRPTQTRTEDKGMECDERSRGDGRSTGERRSNHTPATTETASNSLRQRDRPGKAAPEPQRPRPRHSQGMELGPEGGMEAPL